MPGQKPQARTNKQAAGRGAQDQLQPCSGDRHTSPGASSCCRMGEEPVKRHLEQPGASWAFLDTPIEFSAYICGHRESYIAAPATGNSCHATFLSDSGVSFFLFGTCCSPIKSEPCRASYAFGEKEVSLRGEQREDPQGYTPCAASEYLHSPSKCPGQQSKWLRTTQVGAGKGCNAAGSTWAHKVLAAFSLQLIQAPC